MGILVVVILLVMILFLLIEPQHDRPRAFGRMLLGLVVVLVIYKLGPTVLALLWALVVAIKPTVVAIKPTLLAIGRFFLAISPYLFAGILLSIDLFFTYAYVSRCQNQRTTRDKWAAGFLGLSAVPAVLGFIGICSRSELAQFVVPAVLLFIAGVACIPKPAKHLPTEATAKGRVLMKSERN